ncbi:MAG: DUF4365 domain-containing protein [Rhodanobacteraceae bacterium]|nr:DUF4365 domain-containing protein [Rhodanobacteraceae bacterium]
MRSPKQEPIGTSALSYVKGDFEAIGWGPVENPSHDLGTDLLIQVRDERRFERGLIVGAQVKGGPSWFKDPDYDDQGNLLGWWFYESTAEHFDDWVRHSLPHLVALYDFGAKKTYWVHVTVDRCFRSEKGCKILVPANQIVDKDHLDALLDVAATQRAAGRFEQQVFHASANTVPPGRRLRYALLAPRLVAPHANRGAKKPLEPEEYLALLVRRRSFQIFGYKQEFPDQLDLSKVDDKTDWRWRFAHAFGILVDDGNHKPLLGLLTSAPHSADYCTAVAVLAAASMDSGSDLPAAEQLLNEVITKDSAAPVDLAWLLLHRAWLKVERGDVTEARQDAANATRALRGDEDDPTATLLAGVAANLLFRTAAFGDGDLEDVINSNDTAPAWWRAQTLSWALGNIDDEAFEDWAGSSDPTEFDTDGVEYLESSRLNAALAADRDAWQSISARQGKYFIRRAQQGGDDVRLLQGLDQLRRAGDREPLARAIRVVLHTGPVSIVREVAERASPKSLSRTTAFTTLTLWEVAADALPQDYASELADWCFRIVSSSEAFNAFREGLGLTFDITSTVLSALGKLLVVASPDIRLRVAGHLLDVPSKTSWPDDWARLTLNLDEASFRAVGIDRLYGKAVEIDNHYFKDALLHQLAVVGSAEARALLIERSRISTLALQCIPYRSRFDPDLVRNLIERLVPELSRIRQDAANSTHGFGGTDVARLIAILNVLHPDMAQWDALLDYLSDPKVSAENKSGAVTRLVHDFGKLDSNVQNRVRAVVPVLLACRFVASNWKGRIFEGATRLAIVAMESPEEQSRATVALLSGTASHRRVAALLIGTGIASEAASALHAVVADQDRNVRAYAAHSIGRIASRSITMEWLPTIDRIAQDRGTALPSAFLEGLLESPFNGHTEILKLVESLKSHGSCRVRALVAQFIEHLPVQA